MLNEPKAEFPELDLKPIETRVLFKEKKWDKVVAFQTRNPPHLGHEFVQKMALTVCDGLFINPVIGKKKKGDFLDSPLSNLGGIIPHLWGGQRGSPGHLHVLCAACFLCGSNPQHLIHCQQLGRSADRPLFHHEPFQELINGAKIFARFPTNGYMWRETRLLPLYIGAPGEATSLRSLDPGVLPGLPSGGCRLQVDSNPQPADPKTSAQ